MLNEVCSSRKANPSHNTVFTLRSLRSLGLPEDNARKYNQADNPASLSPNGPGATRLKAFGFVNTRTLTEIDKELMGEKSWE